jgi:hypothetical protein
MIVRDIYSRANAAGLRQARSTRVVRQGLRLFLYRKERKKVTKESLE